MKRLKIIGSALIVACLATPGYVRAESDGVINIGFTGPLSGGAAQYGADVQRGIELAIDELNVNGGINAGGKKYTFKLVSLDDQYRPNEAAINAKRLVQESNTPIVFCPHSGGILALEGFNEKATPKFLLAAYSSEPAILRQNDNLVFMIPPRYDSYFKAWTAAEMKRFGKRLGLLPTTTAYGNAWKSGFSEAWKSVGGEVLADNAVDYNTTADFSGVVSKALADKPDVMLVGGPSQPTALVMKAARDQGYTGGFVMMDQSKFEQVAKVLPLAKLDGTVGVFPFDRYNGPGVQSFKAIYEKKYGKEREPNSEVVFNYMAMNALARAMSLANNVTDPVAIRAKLADAVRSLPKSKQALSLEGLTPAGHLQLRLQSEIVDHGTYKEIEIPALQ
jgi:branched-chain amino acid transport system substrate-binding protein